MSTETSGTNRSAQLAAIAEAIERLKKMEGELSGALRSAEAQARQRHNTIAAALEQIGNNSLSQPAASAVASLSPLNYVRPVDYSRLVARIRKTAQEHLPAHSVVLVVSKGDAELLKLSGRTGWHFPQNELGIFAGYHPATSAAAISHLEALKVKGANYLLLPSTALWWLDYYAEFRDHLATLYRKCWQDDDCTIFELGLPQAARASRWSGLWRRLARN